MISISSTIPNPNLISLSSSSSSHQSNNINIKSHRPIKIHASSTQKLVITKPVHDHKLQKRAARLAESLSNLVHLHLDTHSVTHSRRNNFVNHVDQNTPTTSPKEDISMKWKEIHGSNDYENILEPLHPWLRREIVKYGEFVQATYDAFDFDTHSEYCGSCKYNQQRFFEKLGLSKNGYKVTKYIYAMSHVDVPQWLERSHLVDTWSKDSNWMGYVAVSDDEETKRIGRRDIVVAWRGTVAPSEWFEDLQNKLEPIGKDSKNKEEAVKVEHGFLDIYKSKSESTRYNKSSASEQVMKEIKRLVSYYEQNGEQVSLTITGHSLGGALAQLNAYEAAESIPSLPVNVISFGAPRVGNIGFKDKLNQMGVKTLRVVVKQDLIPKMPGIMLNEGLQKFDEIMGHLDWVYTHVGTELKLDVGASPYLKHGLDLLGFHSLETYLHLIDGFAGGKESRFRENARRDLALVNKCCGMLRDEMRIPECWYQLGFKGLVCNSYGRWVKHSREPEDIPLSPSYVNHSENYQTQLPCLS